MKTLKKGMLVFVLVTALMFAHMTAFTADYAGTYAQEELELPLPEFEDGLEPGAGVEIEQEELVPDNETEALEPNGESDLYENQPLSYYYDETEDDLDYSLGIEAMSVSATVNSWAELRNAVNDAPANIPTTILIASDLFTANIEIVIPADRRIIIESSSGSDVRTLHITASRAGLISHRHFSVNGTLTLGQNITLDGGINLGVLSHAEQAFYEQDMHDLTRFRVEHLSGYSLTSQDVFDEMLQEIVPFHMRTTMGGVEVHAGGTLTMLDGSRIQNTQATIGGGVFLSGTGTSESARAVFNMYGGAIHNNNAASGGGVEINGNARMNMHGGTISNNRTSSSGGGIGIWSSVAENLAFYMTGGSIIYNFAHTSGGGISTINASSEETVPHVAYSDIFIGPNAVFSGNVAGIGASAPPDNTLPHISANVRPSIWNYLLNNYDISYTGRLGQVPPCFGLSASPMNPNFGTQMQGYFHRPLQTVTITNTSTTNVTLDPLPITPGWSKTECFLWRLRAPMAPNETRTFTFRPNSGFPVGTHDPIITITGTGGTFTVVRPMFVVIPPVSGPPIITRQPQNAYVALGGIATLSVDATGSPYPNIRWQTRMSINGEWVFWGGLADGATTSLLVDGAIFADWAFRAVVTNTHGTVFSDPVRIIIQERPDITRPPQDRTVAEGQNTTFSVVASGLPAPSFQWQVSTNNGITWANVNAVSATTDTLRINNVPASSNGNVYLYRVIVTNSAGSVTSGAARLTVTARAYHYQRLTGFTIPPGGTREFTTTLRFQHNGRLEVDLNIAGQSTPQGAGFLTAYRRYDGTTIWDLGRGMELALGENHHIFEFNEWGIPNTAGGRVRITITNRHPFTPMTVNGIVISHPRR